MEIIIASKAQLKVGAVVKNKLTKRTGVITSITLGLPIVTYTETINHEREWLIIEEDVIEPKQPTASEVNYDDDLPF